MKGIKGLTLGTAVAAFLVVGGLMLASQVFAATGTAQISDGSAAPGGSDTVELSALDVTDPGLGAWTIDIFYDPDVITPVDCSATQGGVCNVDFPGDAVRITGAVAVGLEGDTSLGTIEFECADAEGESPLEVSLFTFADGTLGGPQDIDATTVDGTFTCAEAGPTATEAPQLPSTGVAGGDDNGSMAWIIAALAGLGLASMAAYGALRLRENRA
jgi:hypothetical protein